jgi:triosephosphate isomerase
MKHRLFVANWKMNKPFALALDFCTNHKENLKTLSTKPHTEIVICPSFEALFSIAEIFADTMISVGAQTCSTHERGAYTGQVNAQSIKEVGCDYCIIGHSEQRQFMCVSNEDVAHQATWLLEADIEPIICIGETKKEFDDGTSIAVLEQQLIPILSEISSHHQPFTIAYEPVWAIGTGIIPEKSYLASIFTWLAATLTMKVRHHNWRLIYGGSVDPDTVGSLMAIKTIHGFLIGNASLDFQKFEKIVSWKQ